MPEVQQSHLRAHRGGEARNIFVEAFAVAAAVGHAMRITLVNMFRKPVTVPALSQPGFGDSRP